jgi:hypothetical protein
VIGERHETKREQAAAWEPGNRTTSLTKPQGVGGTWSQAGETAMVQPAGIVAFR